MDTDILRESDDSYRITLAVAGFRPEDIEVMAQQDLLTVTGKRAEDNGQGEYLHRGIAARPFERRFQASPKYLFARQRQAGQSGNMSRN
jgi:molecular chaperone IbpA